MKKFLKNISIFCLPIALLLIVLPTNDQLRYEGLEGDCSDRGSWIYNRLYMDTGLIDVLFLGSSHTINGVEDAILERSSEKGKRFVNMGYCRLGRDLSYALLKEVVTNKKPSKVIVEIRESENRYSHPIFPFVAQTKDVLLAEPILNRDYLSNIWEHIFYKVDLTQDFLYQVKDTNHVEFRSTGFPPWVDTSTLVVSGTEFEGKSESEPLWQQQIFDRFSKSYLQRISALCVERDIDLFFLYLPSFHPRQTRPTNLEWYEKYGELLFPPDSLQTSPLYRHDVDHFNHKGAEILSNWLSEKLEKKEK